MLAVDGTVRAVDKPESRVFARLITAAMVMAPFTQLRVWRIGATEICSLLVVALIFLVDGARVRLGGSCFIFTKFWAVFLVLSGLGSGLNYLVFLYPSGTQSSMLFDLASYAMVALVCFGMEASIYSRGESDLWSVLESIFVWTSSILFLLLIVSRFQSSILGLSIVHYNRFRPLAENVHHVSMVVAPLCFIGLRASVLEERWVRRLLLLALVVSDVVVTISTGTLKGLLGLLAGVAAMPLIMLWGRIPDRRLRVCILLVVAIASVLILCLYAPRIMDSAIDFFTSHDIKGGRQWLYRVSVEKVLRSPILGYGPGAHADHPVELGAVQDSHQTFLTVALQGGLLSVLAYVLLHHRIVTLCVHSPAIFGAYVSILTYALGGDIMRRLPMWVFLILLYYSSMQLMTEERRDCSR